jgi:hypothetical protein
MRRDMLIARGGPRLTPASERCLLVVAVMVAVMLMLAGLVLLFVGPSTGVAIPLITVGVALTAMVKIDQHRAHAGR